MNSLFHERQLKSLRSIQPDPVFLKWSKKAIMASARHEERRAIPRISLATALSYAMRPMMAVGTMAILAFAVMAQMPTESPRIASLDGADIAIEQKKVASDDKSAEVKYFKGISPSISLALTDIIDPSTDYGSADHIKKGIALLNRN